MLKLLSRCNGRLPAALLIACLPVLPAHAQTPAATVPTGTFITEKGWGTLSIKREAGKVQFSISAVGSNTHTCELEGEIRGLRADLTEKGEKEGCIVSFKPLADRVTVSGSANGLCSNFCGMRATFEGDYFMAPAQCQIDPVEKSRAQFRRLYDKKQFAEARALLESGLKLCGKYIGAVTEAWMRNDLAVALHKLGERKACLDMLAPLSADAAKKDSQLRDDLPPSDAEAYLPVMRATRVNLKLCNQLKP